MVAVFLLIFTGFIIGAILDQFDLKMEQVRAQRLFDKLKERRSK